MPLKNKALRRRVVRQWSLCFVPNSELALIEAAQFLEWDYAFHDNDINKIDMPQPRFELGTVFGTDLKLAFTCCGAENVCYCALPPFAAPAYQAVTEAVG